MSEDAEWPPRSQARELIDEAEITAKPLFLQMLRRELKQAFSEALGGAETGEGDEPCAQ
jgi:hypothetical protein